MSWLILPLLSISFIAGFGLAGLIMHDRARPEPPRHLTDPELRALEMLCKETSALAWPEWDAGEQLAGYVTGSLTVPRADAGRVLVCAADGLARLGRGDQAAGPLRRAAVELLLDRARR